MRRPPLAHVLPTAHDMAREYRVISALAGTAVPVAQAVAFCADVDVLGQLTYLEVWNHERFLEKLAREPFTDSDANALAEFGI